MEKTSFSSSAFLLEFGIVLIVPETVIHFYVRGEPADANGMPDSLYGEQCGLRTLCHLLSNAKNAIELSFHLSVDTGVWRWISYMKNERR